MVLLVLLLAIQGAGLRMLVVLRPYSSLLLNLTEAACCSLDLASLSVLAATYGFTRGGDGSSSWVGRLQVGRSAPGLHCCHGLPALSFPCSCCHPAYL